MSKSKKIARNHDIVWRCEVDEKEIAKAEADGEDISQKGTVILIVSDMIHELNFVGGKIWMLCDGTKREEDIADELLKMFAVDKNELRKDVNEFVSKLIHNGWLYYV
ncbi:MAG: PqqD family peptide modification chaperone [Candidatus Firestonebacteria bacterium]|nr:PqqD family peptide modification chaperone [Candidatus Firestonebacteria bacterium]